MSGSALDRRTAESLLELTRRMDAAAAAADWDRVAAHDDERRALLANGTGLPDETSATDLPVELVDALREADRALLARAREARASLGERTSRTRAERDVCRTYADVMQNVGARGTHG